MTFGLDGTAIGLIGSGTYVGYLLALTLAGLLASRLGPRPLIVASGVAATTGLALVAFAPNLAVLVIGLLLAGTSSGWSWAPYSDAVRELVAEQRRDRVLAIVPNGTAFGMAIAGLLALAVPWRPAWVLFAVAALAVTAYNAWLLRGLRRPAPAPRETRIRYVPAAGPLLVTAFLFGVQGSVYWTFAADLVDSNTSSGAAAPLFWTLVGIAGIGGLLTARTLARLGLRHTHALLFSMLAAAIALLAIAPGATVAIGLSAVLYGPAFMAASAVLAVWSYQVFPSRPAAGFSAVVFFLGIGTIVGPVVFGVLADGIGVATTFLLAAALALGTLAARPPAAP
jgi:predicted MFS family arabinose efflux permease